MRVRLTPLMVARAKPGPSRIFLWDTEVNGLGLLIYPSGKRSWVYQSAATGNRRITLDATSLDTARHAALALKTGHPQELEPPPVSKPRSEALTVNALLDAWLDAMEQRPSPPASIPKIRSCLDSHVRIPIGKIEMSKLKRLDVLGIRDRLAARERRGMANQVIAYIRAAFRWAEDAQLIAEAPRWRVPRLRLGSRTQSLTEEQWARLIQVLKDPNQDLHPIGRLVFLGLALTGCRRGEISTLRWSDVRDDGSFMLVRHKTSKQSGPKLIQGNEELRQLFAEARRVTSAIAATIETDLHKAALLANPYVFPSISRNGFGKPIGHWLRNVWIDIRSRAQLPPTMTPHGIRGAFITETLRQGVPLATVAAMVGHESPLTTLRHYTSPTQTEVQSTSARIARWIASRGALDDSAASACEHSDQHAGELEPAAAHQQRKS